MAEAKKCPTPWKTEYAKSADASAALRRMKRRERTGLQAYKCRCGVFHLGHRRG